MLTLRNLNWPEDRAALLALDTSFTTERVFRVITTPDGFVLKEDTISPSLHKVYDLTGEVDQIPSLDYVLIAELDRRVIGLAALSFDTLDRRAIVRHLYVDHPFRGRGFGRAMIQSLVSRARQEGMRCLWLETQDVNYDGIQFYISLGFEWCGLDLSLDEHDGSPNDETAVFFMKAVIDPE